MTQWRHPLLALLASAALVAAVACDNSSNDRGSPAAAVSPQASAVAAMPAPDSDGDGVPDAEDACPNAKEDSRWTATPDGCPDTLNDLLALAEKDIDGFWAREFPQLRMPYTPPRAITGYTSAIQTGCGAAVPQNAFFCGPDDTIYYDDALMQTEFDTIGDYGPVFILAHEWGHLVQAELGITQDATFTIELELQADCFAGAYTQDAEGRHLLEQGDLDEAAEGLIQAGDPRGVPWFAPGAHGTSRQRLDAFTTGYEGGLGACL